jgi:hypothetical protein
MTGTQLTSDRALGGGRLSAADVGGWLNPYGFRAEAALWVGRDLAATVRDSILRRLSRRGGIHVAGMSDRWLRMHETEYDKHRTEL